MKNIYRMINYEEKTLQQYFTKSKCKNLNDVHL